MQTSTLNPFYRASELQPTLAKKYYFSHQSSIIQYEKGGTKQPKDNLPHS